MLLVTICSRETFMLSKIDGSVACVFVVWGVGAVFFKFKNFMHALAF